MERGRAAAAGHVKKQEKRAGFSYGHEKPALFSCIWIEWLDLVKMYNKNVVINRCYVMGAVLQ